jgi:hypothetical protein
MKAITPKMQCFITAFIETGDRKQALKLAGYRGNPNALRVQLWRLMRKPHVRAAMQQQTLEALESDGPLGRAVLRELAEKAESESVRLRAAEILLDRAVGPVPDRIDHLHLHRRGPDLSPDEIRQRAAALRLRLGMVPALAAPITLEASKEPEEAADAA